MYTTLNKKIAGDVFTDETTLLLYASDASIYHIKPTAVAIPKSIEDCREIIHFAHTHNIGIIPRAGGTSLAGQVVGKHMVVDTSRYLNKILDIDIKNQTAIVEPGVIPSQLNTQLSDSGLMFAPDPSTLDRCTIGGMIGNNAWGAHCPSYGTTADNIESIECLLSNSETIKCEALSAQQFSQRQLRKDSEGHIYNTINNIITNNKQLIEKNYPQLSKVPCNAGYALNKLAAMQPWTSNGKQFNLASLICGSEGTLAFIANATVKLVKKPQYQTMICAHFHDLQQALQAVPVLNKLQPSAIELLDNYLLDRVRYSKAHQQHIDWLHGNPAALLFIEFSDHEKSNVNSAVADCVELLKQHNCQHAPTLQQQQTQKAWHVRRAGLGLLMGVTSPRKPVTFIEDSAVPVEHLAAFVTEIGQLMARYKVDCVYYGSVSMGLIHLRPLLDLHDREDISLLTTLMHETATLLKKYHGTISAKHGDGIARGQKIKFMLGNETVNLLAQIKTAFDPTGIFNPRKIVNPLPHDQSLRLKINNDKPSIDSFFKWQNENGFERGFEKAIEKCNGAGACRKTFTPGTMCPSYRATGNEIDSTRGRANLFREIVNNADNIQPLTNQSITLALSHCLSCKACKTECPANVDMAKMNSEHQYQLLKSTGKSPLHNFLINFEKLSKIGSIMPSLSRQLSNSRLIKKLLNIHPYRTLPEIHPYNLNQWMDNHQPHGNSGSHGDVIFFSDPFTFYYDVKSGIAAIEVLERFGYRVKLSTCFPSIRTMISHGLLDQVNPRVKTVLDWLFDNGTDDTPIIGIEPSEILSYRDEALDLDVDTNKSNRIANLSKRIYLFEEFISNNLQIVNKHKISWSKNSSNIIVHAHCHQKSLIGMDSALSALSLIPNCKVNPLDTGCCGMAGMFGYSKANYDLSMQISELELFPKIKNADNAIVVATGTSCRQQIKHGLNKQALSIAEALRSHMMD